MNSPVPPTAASASARRYDLDWIRVGAFGLLILYHVALAYSPWDWHIRSEHRFDWLKPALLLTNPWRLTLLFLVSGAAVRLMSRRRTAAQTLKSRIERLLPPLIFGVLILVPIQSWIEAMDKGYWSDGSWAGFWAWTTKEFSPRGIANGVPFNHLWFLLYIFVYGVLAALLLRRPDWIEKAQAWVENALRGWRVLVVPLAYLIVIRLVLFPIFGLTNRLSIDWYNHFLSFGAFLFGFLLVERARIWADIERFRWISLGVAAVAMPVMMLQHVHPGGGAYLGIPRGIVFAIDQWAMITAILGFASRWLRQASSPVLSYLSNAVFTCYLAHQTILVAALWVIRPAHLPAVVEASALVAITFGGSLVVYELAKRVPLIRPIFGLKPGPDGWLPWTRTLTGRFKGRRLLLGIGVGAFILAAASVLLAATAYPGFDHARQFLSELGGASARAPGLFNAGVFLAGVLAGVSGVGFALAVAALTGRRATGVVLAVVFIAAGAGLALSSLYPWPDPRHMAINLGLGIQIAPLLLLWGLWPNQDLTRLKWFLAGVFVLMTVLTLFTHHVIFFGMVNPGNVGWWERAYAVVLAGWVAVAAVLLERRLHEESRREPD